MHLELQVVQEEMEQMEMVEEGLTMMGFRPHSLVQHLVGEVAAEVMIMAHPNQAPTAKSSSPGPPAPKAYGLE